MAENGYTILDSGIFRSKSLICSARNNVDRMQGSSLRFQIS